MDKIEVMLIIFAIVVSILSVLFMQAYAEEWYWFYSIPFDKDPAFCFYDFKNNTRVYEISSKHQMIKAVKEWDVKADFINLDIFFVQHTSKRPTCDVTISFVETIDDYKGYKIAGQTNCNERLPKKCNIMLNESLTRIDSPLHNVLKHEVGHAFGLGHREADTINDKVRTVISNDVMIYQNGKHRWLLQEDISALEIFYKDLDIVKYVIRYPQES